jgi:signal transduction histidine kinase
MWSLDYESIQNTVTAEAKASFVNTIDVFDINKVKVASIAGSSSESLHEIIFPISYVDIESVEIGHIVVKIDTSSKEEILNDLIKSFLIQLFFSMSLISILLFSYCKKIITKPLKKLEASMEYIADDTADLTQRLSYVNNNDEISRVSSTFNKIIEKIEQLMLVGVKKNEELHETIDKLNKMQDMLVESEKTASLGSLVAGVAHEVNTPVGIGITATSSLVDEIDMLNRAIENKTLSSKKLTLGLEHLKTAAQLTLNHLHRVSKLISNFKQVAVDQSIDEERTINLKQYVGEIHTSLLPRFKNLPIEFIIQIDDEINLTLNAGLLAQVFSNLIINAYIHAFDEQEEGHIVAKAFVEKEQTVLSIEDNGKGMTESAIESVFEPFYTTKRNKGGTGLGSNIIFNIVNHKFGGTIVCKSTINVGTTFTFTIPKTS